MKHTVIEMDRFSFAVNGHVILRVITLAVHKGECVSIIGPNGAGKTTLLKCLDRIHTAGSGEIRIAGKPLVAYTQKELARHVSYVPQADGNVLPFTVSEFVMMGRYPYLSPFSPPNSRDKEAVERALAMTGTTEFVHRSLSTLSGGERQRVFIAAALAQEAGILLLDEPATFLDPLHATEIHRLLARINSERGVTLLSVTHDINIAALTSHRILALKNGRVVFWGTPEGLMDEGVLKEIYGKSFLFVKHPRTGKDVIVADVP
jgi:iron complex transport system ATP-binding protein